MSEWVGGWVTTPPTDVEQFLQAPRRLELGLFAWSVVGAPREKVQQWLVLDAHLHLLLGRAVAVANDGEHRAKFLGILGSLSRRLLPLPFPVAPFAPLGTICPQRREPFAPSVSR